MIAIKHPSIEHRSRDRAGEGIIHGVALDILELNNVRDSNLFGKLKLNGLSEGYAEHLRVKGFSHLTRSSLTANRSATTSIAARSAARLRSAAAAGG